METRFSEKSTDCLSNIFPQLSGRSCDLIQEGYASVHDRSQVFEIVTGKVVATPSSSKGFDLGPKKVGCGNGPQRESAGNLDIDRSSHGLGIPTIGKAKNSLVQRHYIQRQASVAPTADWRVFSRVLFKPKRA